MILLYSASNFLLYTFIDAEVIYLQILSFKVNFLGTTWYTLRSERIFAN